MKRRKKGIKKSIYTVRVVLAELLNKVVYPPDGAAVVSGDAVVGDAVTVHPASSNPLAQLLTPLQSMVLATHSTVHWLPVVFRSQRNWPSHAAGKQIDVSNMSVALVQLTCYECFTFHVYQLFRLISDLKKTQFCTIFDPFNSTFALNASYCNAYLCPAKVNWV